MKYTIAITITSLLIYACGSSRRTQSQATPQSTPAEVVVVEDTTPPTPPPAVIESPEPEPVQEEIVIEETTVEETVVESTEEVVAPVELFNHDSLDTILKNNVTAEGNVNYAGIKSNWSSLRNYIKSLSDTMPTDEWSQEDKLAYWMNAYNAMTIDLILRNYPLASIKDIDKPWDQRLWKLGTKWYNLEEIEHKILRKMGDPRIHFGINCASFSCPPILNEAFTAGKVDSQLDVLARNFVNDTKRNTITTDRVDVSKIFSWFKGDFTTDGSLVDFLNKYSDNPIADKAKVRYREYNWSLNK